MIRAQTRFLKTLSLATELNYSVLDSLSRKQQFYNQEYEATFYDTIWRMTS